MMSTSTPIGIWLIEDDAFYRRTVADLLDGADGVEIRRSFFTCEAALDALRSDDAPEVILLDIGLPGMKGTEGARRFKVLSPASQIIMLTVHEDEDRIFEAICAGASGYLLKSASMDRILAAIHDVRAGGVPLTAPIARKVLHLFTHGPAPKTDYGLSEREREVLQLTAEGLTHKHIAERLFLSPYTVETHLRNTYTKLHVQNGVAAVSKAIRERLI